MRRRVNFMFCVLLRTYVQVEKSIGFKCSVQSQHLFHIYFILCVFQMFTCCSFSLSVYLNEKLNFNSKWLREYGGSTTYAQIIGNSWVCCNDNIISWSFFLKKKTKHLHPLKSENTLTMKTHLVLEFINKLMFLDLNMMSFMVTKK